MTPARRAAFKAFRDYLDDFDGTTEDEPAFIAGYLRGRGEAHQCELERNQASGRPGSNECSFETAQTIRSVALSPNPGHFPLAVACPESYT